MCREMWGGVSGEMKGEGGRLSLDCSAVGGLEVAAAEEHLREGEVGEGGNGGKEGRGGKRGVEREQRRDASLLHLCCISAASPQHLCCASYSISASRTRPLLRAMFAAEIWATALPDMRPAARKKERAAA